MNKKVRFNTNIDIDILKRMKSLAASEGRSLNFYIEKAFLLELNNSKDNVKKEVRKD